MEQLDLYLHVDIYLNSKFDKFPGRFKILIVYNPWQITTINYYTANQTTVEKKNKRNFLSIKMIRGPKQVTNTCGFSTMNASTD